MTNDNLLCHIMKVINNYINSSICYMILVRLTVQVALNRKLKRHLFKLLFYQQNQINYTVSKRKKKKKISQTCYFGLLNLHYSGTLVLWYDSDIVSMLSFHFQVQIFGIQLQIDSYLQLKRSAS